MPKAAKPLPRGVRNRNPGNIRFVETASHFQGQTGSDGAFCIFDTAEHGIRAIGVVLLTYYRKHSIRTIREAIARWAPGSENNTSAYIAAVALRTKIGADDLLNFYDAPILAKLVTAIIWHENGQCPYTNAQIRKAVDAAIGSS